MPGGYNKMKDLKNEYNALDSLAYLKNLSSDKMIAAVMPALLSAIKDKAFVEHYEATDEEALGLVVSKFCKWNAIAITEVAVEAYEDSGYDDLARHVRRGLNPNIKEVS